MRFLSVIFTSSLLVGMFIFYPELASCENEKIVGEFSGYEVDSCVCLLQGSKKNETYLFESGPYGEEAKMKLYGKKENLELVETTEIWPLEEGKEYRRVYKKDNIDILFKYTADFCDSVDDHCDSWNLDVVVTVTDGNREESLQAKGGCGC